jgi:hypothetical protein
MTTQPSDPVNDRMSWSDLVELIGPARALDLSRQRGGRSVYVPSPANLTEGCPLVMIVGAAAASRLAGKYSGARLHVPNGPGKRALVRAMRGQGKTISEIVAATRYTERHVYTVLAEPPGPGEAAVMPAAPPLLAMMGGK